MREQKNIRIKQLTMGTSKWGDRMSDAISRKSGVSRSSRNTESTNKKNQNAAIH